MMEEAGGAHLRTFGIAAQRLVDLYNYIDPVSRPTNLPRSCLLRTAPSSCRFASQYLPAALRDTDPWGPARIIALVRSSAQITRAPKKAIRRSAVVAAKIPPTPKNSGQAQRQISPLSLR